MKPILGYLITSIDLEETKMLYRQNWKVICLSEDASYQTIMPGSMMGSILLPPYESMDYLLDGRIDAFAMEYSNYLLYTSPEAEIMISIILAALYKGINIVIYVPKQEFELGFYQVFANCILHMCGIYIGSNIITDFCYNPSFNNINMIRLYNDGFIMYPELLISYDGPITDPQLCIRLAYEIGYLTQSEQEAVEYIRSYKTRIDESGKFLQKGFIKS